MEKQLIVSIGREYGSAGHEIAKLLSERLDVPLYDRNLLDEVADTKNVDSMNLAKYDEVPKKHFFSRTVRGYSNSPEQNVAEMQFDLLKMKAADGDSFVIVGRCSEEIFNSIPGVNVVSVFITGDYEERVKRIMEVRNLDRKHAIKEMERHDKRRAAYHDHFCTKKWGAADTYDLCINSSKLGLEGTLKALEQYIQDRLAVL